MNRKISVGLIQMACCQDKKINLITVKNLILEAAGQGAEIVCLQELFNTIYCCFEENYDHFSLAETMESDTFRELTKLASEKKIVLIVPYFEKRGSGIYHNSALVIERDGTILGNYRKSHIPDDPGYHEKFYFTPGDSGYQVFDTSCGKIGVLICWDQWFPEAARITSLMGAEILFYPTAIGWEKEEDEISRNDQLDAWMTIQRSHAIANGVYVVAVNRTGKEKLTTFWGHSFIANPIGKIIASASDQEEVLVHTVDLSLIGHYRTHWPFLRDRRIDTYKPIQKRYLD